MGGEGGYPISFGDQAYTRMSIDIGGYWPAVDTSMGWKNAAWAMKESKDIVLLGLRIIHI